MDKDTKSKILDLLLGPHSPGSTDPREISLHGCDDSIKVDDRDEDLVISISINVNMDDLDDIEDKLHYIRPHFEGKIRAAEEFLRELHEAVSIVKDK